MKCFQTTNIVIKLIFSTILCVNFISCSSKKYDVMTQISPVKNLINGDYQGKIKYGILKEYGDFGIGTFSDVNGEMVALDNVFYQITSDGLVHIVSDTQFAPFASINFFKSDYDFKFSNISDYDKLRKTLSQEIKFQEFIYAIKIKAKLSYIKLRSPQKQQRPYPDLKKVIAQQKIFEHKNISGTLVGYYNPDVLGDITVSGYHFHFISDNKKVGGHVLELNILEAQTDFDIIDEMQIKLYKTNFNHNSKSKKNINNLFQGN